MRKVTHLCEGGGLNAIASVLVLHNLGSGDCNWLLVRVARDFTLQGVHTVLRLDYVSCALTILSTILIGRRLWQGWVIAGANSMLICIIAVRTAQFGFVPANLFCLALYAHNLVSWRRT